MVGKRYKLIDIFIYCVLTYFAIIVLFKSHTMNCFDFSPCHLTCSSYSVHVLQLKLYSWPLLKKNNSQYTKCPSLWVWMVQFIPQKLRCAHRNAGLLCPHSSLRNQDRHSCVNDAVPTSSSPCSLLLNTQTPFLSLLFDVETPSTFPVNLRDFWA